MEPDFSGFATKAGLKCSDGRIIMPEAFKHMDGKTVPLVWQHGHSTPDNVLGHAVLEARPDGVYAYGFFNDTPQGLNAKKLVTHKDITALSIYANQLVERGKQVFHGVIRELSLVLSGANPGAKIDFVTIAHSDGDEQVLEDEAVIYTGLPLEHEDMPGQESSATDESVAHADGRTLQQVYDELTEEQKSLVHFMVGEALTSATGGTVAQSGTEEGTAATATGTTETTDESSSSSGAEEDENKNGAENSASQSNENNGSEDDLSHEEGQGTEMPRNVFDQSGTATGGAGAKHTLSHADIESIVGEAKRIGSLREATQNWALAHGIDNIDLLFPDARTLTDTPDFNKRRTEWVAGVMANTKHTPFSRVKSLTADLTLEEARAKGYVKGALKKEEFFGITKRTTTPTTVYKKQKLDRDDILDITDFDVVAWLKQEMRIMLEEEVARAILIGDGREIGDADKIKDPVGAADGAGIRSILNDHELYVTTVNVNVADANSSYAEVVDAILDAMEYYKGTGTPDFYTTIKTLNNFLKLKDSLGRRIYPTKADVAAAIGVASIITVEPMNDETDLLGIIVNLVDYSVGADRGGEVSFFDDFDIDYNQQKYLTETRLSGALVKIKAALVIKSVASTDVLLANPTKPTFVASTGVVTIPSVTHVVYKNAAGDTLSAGAQTAISASGESLVVIATAASGYYFANDAETYWTFTRRS